MIVSVVTSRVFHTLKVALVSVPMGDRMSDLIEEGIDVAIRVGDLADSRLISRRLAPNRLCAFASPENLARRGVPSHPDQLVQHDA